MSRPYKDLTGQMFGMWEVLSEAEPIYDKRHHLIRRWNCRCTCESKTQRIVNTYNLTSGHSTSCGCYQKEVAITAMNKARKQANTFIIKDDYCEVYDNSNNMFLIDIDDIDYVKKYYFYVDKQSDYVHTHIWNAEQQSDYKMSLNVYLTGEKYADHINHNPRDNRRCNLRVSTNDLIPSNQAHNSINHILGSNNTSGYKGVSWSKAENKWKAYIGVNGKTINLGTYINKDDAIIARKQAEEKYYPGWGYEESINQNIIL